MASELVVPAELFQGSKGIAISSSEFDGLIDLSIRMAIEEGRGKAQVNIALKGDELAKMPIQFQDALSPVAAWAEQVIAKESMHIELNFRGVRAPLSAPQLSMQKIWPFLGLARTLGRLHLVAKSLGSDLKLSENFELSEEDLSDINLIYTLLKGERCAINMGPIEFTPNESIDLSPERDVVITTSIMFSILGEELGAIPVSIGLPSSRIETVENSSKCRLKQTEGNDAWISYDEHDFADGALVRRAPTA